MKVTCPICKLELVVKNNVIRALCEHDNILWVMSPSPYFIKTKINTKGWKIVQITTRAEG